MRKPILAEYPGTTEKDLLEAADSIERFYDLARTSEAMRKSVAENNPEFFEVVREIKRREHGD